jgi:hypothetical protein
MNSFWENQEAIRLRMTFLLNHDFQDILRSQKWQVQAVMLRDFVKTMSETRSGASRFRRVPPLQSTQNHMISRLRHRIPPQMTSGVENTVFFLKKMEKKVEKNENL